MIEDVDVLGSAVPVTVRAAIDTQRDTRVTEQDTIRTTHTVWWLLQSAQPSASLGFGPFTCLGSLVLMPPKSYRLASCFIDKSQMVRLIRDPKSKKNKKGVLDWISRASFHF